MTSFRSRLGRLLARAAFRSARTFGAAAACLLVGASSAQGPSFAPTYAYVQEAEPIDLTLAPDVDERWLDTIGLLEDGRLSIAFVDRQDRGIRLAFRLAGEAPVTIRALLLGDASGAFQEAPLGSLTIVPSVATGASPLRRRGSVHFGEGAVLHAWRLVNESAEAQVVSELAFAASDVTRPVVVARVRGSDEDPPDLPTWSDRLRSSVAEAAPEGRHAVPARIEAALRDLLPAADVREPGRLHLVLAPGETLDLALVSASLALDLSNVRVLVDPLLHGAASSGEPWIRSLSEPVRAGPWP